MVRVRPVALSVIQLSPLQQAGVLCGALVLMAALSIFVLSRLPLLVEHRDPAVANVGVAPVRANRLDDAGTGPRGERFTYVGSWEHLVNVGDGRIGGTSARSFKPGDAASFIFTGRGFTLLGVRGSNGGDADLRIDGRDVGTLHFYAPQKEPAAEIFQSGPLSPGRHVVGIIVSPPGEDPSRRFVNIDGATLDP